jgi:hypothetical protein
MGNAINLNLTLVIVNFVKHTIIAHPNTPLMLKPHQSFDTLVTGISFNFVQDP